MKRRAESPLLDDVRPRRSKRMYREDDLQDTQKMEYSAFLINSRKTMALQTTRTDLDEPMSQLPYIGSQQMSPQEPQDVEMTMGGASQEMYFGESQAADEGSQTWDAPKPLYKNTTLDITSSWARRWRRQDIEGGEVFYQPEAIPLGVANAWYQALDALEAWYQPTLTVYGRPHLQPRSIAAYVTDPSLPAPKYSNHEVELHHPYPAVLQYIQDIVSHTLGVGFDHVMLNRYASGKVGIGKHRDTKENQVIAVLSLGTERTFVMTPQVSSKGVPKVRCGDRKWTLGNGSLLVMQQDTQKNWKHEIPKEAKVREGRISLTFRQIVHA